MWEIFIFEKHDVIIDEERVSWIKNRFSILQYNNGAMNSSKLQSWGLNI